MMDRASDTVSSGTCQLSNSTSTAGLWNMRATPATSTNPDCLPSTYITLIQLQHAHN